MTKPFKVFLFLIVGLPAAGVLLTGLNYLLVLQALRINKEPLAEIASQLPPIEKPLVLESSEGMKSAARDFLQGLDLAPQVIEALPGQHPLLIDLEWIARINPYPPLLGEYNPNYGRPNSFSFGYIDREGNYHQMTFYSGEADTTPSFLVKKARRGQMHNGDYFTSYAFLLSRAAESDLVSKDSQGTESPPELEVVRWGTFRGGSYDGFEEILIPPAATLVELALLTAFWLLLKARQRA
jgi:hypothetical protein